MIRAPPSDDDELLLMTMFQQVLENKQMALSDYFPKGESKYLKADDLKEGTEIRITIDRVAIEAIEREGKAGEDRAVVYFRDKEKGLVLNTTNGKKLVEAYGDSPEAQVGKDVILYRDTVDFKGQMVPCLRIRIPAQEVAAGDVPF